ncbi:hypothetical protein [Helicobacter burdigaliensis]|uniref:hypothetical protein n=1 Tax=Helicobacter burdigaliensis TaxID=2315334 RepID=UPI000EF6DBB5|nr:hypothetical protein [Helicobacter burdigaliensis]
MTKTFRNIHIYLSLFFLPVALIYAITGIFYISGFDQDSGAKLNTYTHKVQATANINEADILTNYLKENNIALPKATEPKMDKKSGALTIGSVHYAASIKKVEETNNTITYSITTKERSILGDLIMLHKSKGAWYFNILAIGFGITLILLYASGLMITLFANKKKRGIQYATILAGLIATIVLGCMSVL